VLSQNRINLFKLFENNMKKTSAILALAALGAVAGPCAMADDTGFYLGANLGQSRAKIDDARISAAILGSGFSAIDIVDDRRDAGYKLFGGYQFNRNIAVEGGYFDLGKFGYAATTLPPGTLNGEIKLRGVNLDLVGTLPLSEKWSAIGRVGANYAQARDHFSGTGAVVVGNPYPSKRQTNYKFGLGLQYVFSEALAVRAEAERYRVNDALGNQGDVNMFSLGLIYRFGAKAAASAPRPAPAYVAPAAAAPVVLAPPAPAPQPVPVSEKVTFSAEALFDFDRAQIKPEGKAALDALLAKLQGMNAEVMVTVGFADSAGADAYNQKLSLRRAEAVKAYLVAKGVDGARVYTEGKGESQPVADNASAQGRAKNRRVTVEVVGSRTVMK
jgi:OmpA-OmpF porin, OOP family